MGVSRSSEENSPLHTREVEFEEECDSEGQLISMFEELKAHMPS